MQYLPCRNPTLGLSVRMQLTLPKVGKRSPPGLLKIQKTIEGSNLLALMRSLYQWKGLEE